MHDQLQILVERMKKVCVSRGANLLKNVKNFSHCLTVKKMVFLLN